MTGILSVEKSFNLPGHISDVIEKKNVVYAKLVLSMSPGTPAMLPSLLKS